MNADELQGDALEDAGRDAGHPRLGGKPWSELTADEKREALASPDPDARDDDGPHGAHAPEQASDEPRGLFQQLADDLDAGRLSTDDAVRRLFRGMAAQEDPDASDDDVRAAFYPGEDTD